MNINYKIMFFMKNDYTLLMINSTQKHKKIWGNCNLFYNHKLRKRIKIKKALDLSKRSGRKYNRTFDAVFDVDMECKSCYISFLSLCNIQGLRE